MDLEFHILPSVDPLSRWLFQEFMKTCDNRFLEALWYMGYKLHEESDDDWHPKERVGAVMKINGDTTHYLCSMLKRAE